MARSVPALHRALDVLELFLEESELSPPEITTRLGLPRTTVHELVHTLLERSYLAASPERPDRLRLGVRSFQLGSVFADQLDLAREGRQAAREVSRACEETVHVAVLEGTDVIYIAKAESTHPVRMVSAAGRRLPAHCTAVGKMLLSGLPAETFVARFPPGQDLAGMTGSSITSPDRLAKHLDEVRERGLAEEYCESNEAVACVAAPVYDHTVAMVAAMSISVPILRWSGEREEELAPLVTEGAGSLSEALGYRAPRSTATA